MANTLNLGDGKWARKEGSLLAYNSENNNYKPLPFTFDRASSATRVNKEGLIETVGADQPRVDYLNDSKGALLLEPSRTNSLLQSNQFDTTWILSVSIDLTSGQNGVFGSNDAWLLKRNSTGSRYVQQSLSLSSAKYSYSVYLKAESTNWAYLWSYDDSASVNAYFDLENGVVGNTSGSNLDNATIESVGNGWYRCILTYTQPTTLVRIYPAYSNGNVSTGTDNGIYIQNAQLEQGSYPTSIIKTQGSAVTRVADSCNNAGNDQVINSTQGVLYAEISALANDLSSRIISLSDGTNNNRIHLFYFSQSNDLAVNYRVGGSTVVSFIADLTDITNTSKVAFKWESGNFKMYVDGVLIDTDSNTTMLPSDTLNTLSFSQADGNFDFYGKCKDLRVYNAALSDSELQALTT